MRDFGEIREVSGGEPFQAPPLTILEAVTRKLEEGGLEVTVLQEVGCVTAHLTAGEADIDVGLEVSEERAIVWMISQIRGRIPADRRVAVAELLVRINRVIGGVYFDMDIPEGRVRIRGMLDWMDTQTAGVRIDRLVSATAVKGEQWYPAIMAVAFGDAEPLEAFEREVIAEAAETQTD